MSEKLSPAQKRVMDGLDKYGAIMWDSEERYYGFVNGPAVNARTFRCLLRKGAVEASKDAMFGVQGQTFRAVK